MSSGIAFPTRLQDLDDAAPGTPATGDLFVYDATTGKYTKLAVGTDTYTLVADATQALGVKWAASGGGSLPGTLGQVLLSDGASGATVTNTPTVDTTTGAVFIGTPAAKNVTIDVNGNMTFIDNGVYVMQMVNNGASGELIQFFSGNGENHTAGYIAGNDDGVQIGYSGGFYNPGIEVYYSYVSFMNGAAVVDPSGTSITNTLTVTGPGSTSASTIVSALNSLGAVGMQILGDTSVSLASDNFQVDPSGNVQAEGNAVVHGTVYSVLGYYVGEASTPGGTATINWLDGDGVTPHQMVFEDGIFISGY